MSPVFFLIFISLLVLVAIETVRYQNYMTKNKKGVVGISYKPTFIYSCLVELVCDSMVQLCRLVSK